MEIWHAATLTLGLVVKRLGPVTVERDANDTLLRRGELGVVNLGGVGVSDQERVSDDPGLGVGDMAGSESAVKVSVDADDVGLVKGEPVLDAVAVTLKAEAGVAGKVLGAALLVEPSAVALVQLEGEVPVVEGLPSAGVLGGGAKGAAEGQKGGGMGRIIRR